ncbi:hypothetical protein [Tardiphaga sp.]|jgi:hypothetical protein|uniref:hypothetical protein n=1 Tax=Tardiphaga sp. TaxID=1926292 RepID=UPI0037DA51DF
MAEAIGAFIVSSLAAEAAVASVASAFSVSVAAVNTAVGTAAILGATIGLQYAMAPKPPAPENGAAPIKQAVPSRIRGYGRNRLAGAYMFFEEINRNSYDVIAFHSGRIDKVIGVYFHDDLVTLSSVGPDGPGTAGVYAFVEDTFGDSRYGGHQIALEIRVGNAFQGAPWFHGFEVGGIWSSAHHGNGVAWLALKCNTPEDPQTTQRPIRTGFLCPQLSLIALGYGIRVTRHKAGRTRQRGRYRTIRCFSSLTI